MSGEYSPSESSCNTARSSTATSNSTPRSANASNTPRTNSAYNTPRESVSGASSTFGNTSKYDESLIPKYYSQLLGIFHVIRLALPLFFSLLSCYQSCVMGVFYTIL